MEEKPIALKEIILKFQKLCHYLFSKWLIVLLCGLSGGLIGFIVACVKKPLYTATTTFVLEEENKVGGEGLGSLAGLASVAGLNIGEASGGGIFQGDNILELYKSRSMIEKTLLTEVDNNGKKTLLVNKYIEFNNLRKSWADNPELKDLNFIDSYGVKKTEFTRLQDSVLGKIVDDINTNYLNVEKPDKKLSIIKADVVAKDEFFAKAFNEQIVKNVNDFYIQTKTKKSLENVNILQQKVDSVRAVMNGAIYRAAAIADATPNLNPTRQTQRIAPVQRSQFSAEANKAMLTELVKNLELSKISLRKEAPLIQVVDQPILPLQKDRLGKAKAIVIGGIIAGLLSLLVLIMRIFLEKIMNDNSL